MNRTWLRMLAAVWLGWPGLAVRAESRLPPEQVEFFEQRIRPVLIEHCYRCHSAEAGEPKGGLRLDQQEGWQAGGESGEPSIVPGQPEQSPLIHAVRHDDPDRAMPPDQPRLPDPVIADLVAWVKMGAPDPRRGAAAVTPRRGGWETVYAERRNWWSLRPLVRTAPPAVKRPDWVRNDVDRFILSALEARGLAPAAPANRGTLARRLSFALTGLPPVPDQVARFVADDSPRAVEALVQALLGSPHFGEHWARHWMDVVHYSDTHGYEWDAPAKNAWMYRDYLTRVFNSDLPIDRFLAEQVAGDLLEPRIDPETRMNESLIGPMALRLGERRHGDSAAVEGVTQEAIANIIDTVSKGFLGTTVACAQCHDHKLDAVPQRDYYALAGVFMSTRWGARCVDAADPNRAVLAELRRIKEELRAEIARIWLGAEETVAAKLLAMAPDKKMPKEFPESLRTLWQRSLASPPTAEEFTAERDARIRANRENLTLLADFTRPDGAAGWRWEGWGMQHGLVRDGEIVVADTGDTALMQIVPAGRWSHVWSQRLAGSLRSPLLDPLSPVTMSLELAGGRHVGQSLIVDQAFHSERMKFLKQPSVGWLTVTAGDFDTLEGSIDRVPRRVYLELATKSLNNYFPPRVGYGGVTESDAADPRSWFGVARVYQHPPGKPPRDELARFAPLWDSSEPWAVRLARLVISAVERWSRGECTAEDARLLDDALQSGLLPNDLPTGSSVARLVDQYRAEERKLQPDRTVGSMADWNEGRDERLGVRGSYTEFGEVVPRGNIQVLGGPGERAESLSSGRLELARSIVSPDNPLTARVFVNRVWLYLFGEGIVRTPDDFGHLGEAPSHPELLDYLALRFVEEGWSLKKLITLLVTSATWQQSSQASDEVRQADPENRLWHHLPSRRLEAEAIRDAILAVSGRLDPALYGAPVDPHRTAEDDKKRLFSGPVDGRGRRSIYTKMTLMEPPRFLAVFNQPLPKLTVGRRDVTNVPAQALTLLNDPFVAAMAKHWSEQALADGAGSPEERIVRMFTRAFARPPEPGETERLVRLAVRSAALRGGGAEDARTLLECQPAWQDVAHAMFNLKEFIYVP